MAFLRNMVWLWTDTLATYVTWMMQTYLTDVWGLEFTRASGIMNVAIGLSKTLPLIFFLIVDRSHYYMLLLLSSVSYAIGLGLLSMSTPPVLAKVTGTCKYYVPECIGVTQTALCYTALALIAVRISAQTVLVALFPDQFEKKKADFKVEEPRSQSKPTAPDQIRRNQGGATSDRLNSPFPPPKGPNRKKVKVFRACLMNLFPFIGLYALSHIRGWSLRFGISAICTLVATMAFWLGSYNDNKRKGSPVTNALRVGGPGTTVLRVLVASSLKMLHKLPTDSSELYEKNEHDGQKLCHTEGLRFLDKAAIKEEPVTNKWRVCTVTEVEETKIIVNMLPIWITFIICGVVTSMGNTYFVEQGKNMNFKVGKLKFPDSILLILYVLAWSLFKTMYTFIASHLGEARQKRYAPPVGIAIATLFSVLCCIVAALVETRRLHVLRDHGLLDKPDEKIPMTVFWLLPQYILLAGLNSFYKNSVASFLSDQSPPSMKKYIVYFNPGLSGLGIMGSVLSVFLVGRVSERIGKENWFQDTSNRSRLDRYYWVLAVLSAANFFWFLVAALRYPYREPTSNVKQENVNEEGNAMDKEDVIPSTEQIERTREQERVTYRED